MRWIRVTSLSPHNLHGGDTSCFSMDVLITFVLSAWSCVADYYKPFGLFLQIPLLQPIPWPLSLDLFCLTQYLAMKGLVFHFSIFSNVSSFSSSVCGIPHFLSYLFKFYCFFAVVPWCFERNRPTPSLHREHTPPGHSIYSPRKVVESRIGQHQLVDETYHKQLYVVFFFYFYPWLLVQLYFSLLLQLHARQVTEPMNLLQV